jgi:hypothetical protein
MSVACLHDLWLGHFARSSLQRDVAFSPPFVHKAVRVSTTGHQGSQYLLCRERGYVRIVTKQGPDSHRLTFEQAWH